MALLVSCMLSILKLTASVYSASRINEAAAIEEKAFHKQVDQRMKAHIMLLKEISTQVGVPKHETDKITKEGSLN